MDVYLGTESQPAENFYGIVFTVLFDHLLIEENSVSFTFTDSWIGTPDVTTLTFSQILFEQGMVEAAIVRTTQTDTSGYGKIATLTMTVKSDISVVNDYQTTLSFEGVEAESADETPLDIFHEPVEVVITEDPTGIPAAAEDGIRLFPNPVKEKLYIKITREDVEEICLLNLYGQCVRKYSNPAAGIAEIDVAGLPQGVYMAQFRTGREQLVKRVVVVK